MGIIIGICDNEDEWRNVILECIMEYASSCQQKIEYRMYASAEEYLQAERHADILLLETEMIGMSGIELKDWLDKTGSREAILFISSQKERMREAFGKNVYGFLEKPIQKEQFFACLDRIIVEKNESEMIGIGKGKYLFIDKIMYIKSIDKYVEIHTVDSIEVGYFSMKECQKVLSEMGFRRVQRSYFKLKYELSTYVSIENNGEKILQGSNILYSACANKDGNIELAFKVGKYDERKVKFELSIMKNYEQEPFFVNDLETQKASYQFEIPQNEQEQEFSVIISGDKLLRDNFFVITLRQDTDIYSYENELVRDSNTVNIAFGIYKEDGEGKSKYKSKKITELEKMEDALVFELSCLNRKEDALINVKPAEEVKMCLNVGINQEIEDVIIWGNLNSKQLKFNDESYLMVNIQKGYSGKLAFSFLAPNEKGIYELEICGQPKEIDAIQREDIYNVISAKRYTIKVE